jgi:hypothetical protein
MRVSGSSVCMIPVTLCKKRTSIFFKNVINLLKKGVFSHRFFIRTTDRIPIRERAATIVIKERGDLVVVGKGVGIVVGGREVTAVVVRTVVGIVAGAVTVNVFTPI